MIQTEAKWHQNRNRKYIYIYIYIKYVHGLVEETEMLENSVDCWPWDVSVAKCACTESIRSILDSLKDQFYELRYWTNKKFEKKHTHHNTLRIYSIFFLLQLNHVQLYQSVIILCVYILNNFIFQYKWKSEKKRVNEIWVDCSKRFHAS